MILPNPSGGRGLYVFDLAAAPEVTSLTLHDRLLLERLLALPAVTPSEIRKAAQEVAIDGAAGRKAARVAVEAAAADQTMGLLTRFHLVTHLLEEAGLERIDWRSFTGDDRALRSMIKGHLARWHRSWTLRSTGCSSRSRRSPTSRRRSGRRSTAACRATPPCSAACRRWCTSLRQWSAGES